MCSLKMSVKVDDMLIPRWIVHYCNDFVDGCDIFSDGVLFFYASNPCLKNSIIKFDIFSRICEEGIVGLQFKSFEYLSYFRYILFLDFWIVQYISILFPGQSTLILNISTGCPVPVLFLQGMAGSVYNNYFSFSSWTEFFSCFFAVVATIITSNDALSSASFCTFFLMFPVLVVVNICLSIFRSKRFFVCMLCLIRVYTYEESIVISRRWRRVGRCILVVFYRADDCILVKTTSMLICKISHKEFRHEYLICFRH